ncbi:hypothetical protein [Clostridium magnum]|uniref:Uncharacterized protein n=1 Tax=Clostridium magnum DSM 2767 TaxID=1121326 RepID=A0A162QIH2_9CLOT|nr:hypothetical protein [Clostridium magnum]KZL88567.1 hypothetical protein CLMAG_60600 [Clostridium magnum DSM 2767]SHI82805.1 hypothetical protein SAMN02745944_04915 [Clostridium magnum DSM 2767]
MSYESNFNKGFREGMAIGKAEILENIINHEFPDYYEEHKYKIRRLSDYEVNLLVHELIETNDLKIIGKYIK